ncbi:SMI1/KNR4 family protein [Leptospira interrogans]|uniref:Knr4/Smi1-like domain-containing protein n=2 Tax=Leptospira interrogans TaxID=173 RepID=Q8F615_LEPIN|nr:SMI1/KNR4 family protein [Leptospira interrogans]AAN48696.1 hypothetical protein LA_1497 [Leptospira interrogans serovar Lai str. 56601]AER02003.1 hypothetical protein LIF_A1204 [Leptospira interrogans serovar Lai str. IPAV]ALE38869.1 hypothetical protein G436_1676 [Leptospira interrogans serovar Hardjo str. Norma]ALO00088.1 hypothetical protein LIH_06950 [Leptospira interrogans serovar Hardjo-prajitno]EKO95726.1 hypothetical protein LEP1GSC057_1136 [Leptospira interrogans str. Brem 329]
MNITNIFKNVWTIQPGTNLNTIQKIESIFKVTFPEDYKQILLWSNGGEGKVGNRYLSLWKIEELVQFNEDYQIKKYIPEIVSIGTDGGEFCYAFDYRNNSNIPNFIEVPLGDLDSNSIVTLGDKMTLVLQTWIHF